MQKTNPNPSEFGAVVVEWAKLNQAPTTDIHTQMTLAAAQAGVCVGGPERPSLASICKSRRIPTAWGYPVARFVRLIFITRGQELLLARIRDEVLPTLIPILIRLLQGKCSSCAKDRKSQNHVFNNMCKAVHSRRKTSNH